MQQRLSKLEAAQRLGVSPSTLDRMIRRGELEIEREGRGDRAKVWVLAPGLSSDAPGGQPVDAGPSPEAELAAVREQVRALQELADYRGKLLDEAEWRYRELLEELRRSQTMLEELWRDGGVTPGTALVALRTGLDGFFAFPPQAGSETRCTTGPTSRRFLHPGPCGFGPAVPGGAGPRRRSAGAVVAPGPGPWRHRLPVKLFVHAAPCRWSFPQCYHGGSSGLCLVATARSSDGILPKPSFS